ncbi:hypothetical protein [Microbulbifer sp. HZ11]|uniref:hypothetical protein n=1 Tax=Microbulbifer sp. HZ11 TaxID=1453501 RepID=UPI0005BE9408|nr:hypothetical protein [Microbulbifer sp. HZ11]
MSSKVATKKVKITAPCMARGKPAPVGTELELPIVEANQLIGTQRARAVAAQPAAAPAGTPSKESK